MCVRASPVLGRRQLLAATMVLSARTGRTELTRTPADGQAMFTNPLDVKLADPCMIRVGRTYYLYATASLPEDVDRGMPVWSSEDMVRWRCLGLAFARKPGGWGTHWFWGPDVVPISDGCLMFYGAFRKIGGKDTGRICVARSTRPEGPFEDAKSPMFEWAGGDAIDACVFRDRDARAYLYFTDANNGRNTIWAARLSQDMLSLQGDPVKVLEPDQPWEVDPVNEGAHVWRDGDRYWMMFSVNDFRNPAYGMGLASAAAPLGPWRKRTAGPILRQAPGLRGPGCAGLIRSPDGRELWAYYHVHLHPDGYARQLCISRARYVRRADGERELAIEPPGSRPQAYPSGAPAPPQARSDDFTSGRLDRRLWTIVDEVPPNWSLSRGAITITALDGDMWKDRCDYRNLFLQPPVRGDFEVRINVEAHVGGNYEQAFLVAWQDAGNYVRLGMLHADGPKFSAAVELNGVYEELLVPNELGPHVTLRISRRGDLWSFVAQRGGLSCAIGAAREARLALPRPGYGAIAPGTKRPYEAVFRGFALRR